MNFPLASSFSLDLELLQPSMLLARDFCKFRFQLNLFAEAFLLDHENSSAAVLVRVEKMSMSSNLNALDVNRQSDRFLSFELKKTWEAVW